MNSPSLTRLFEEAFPHWEELVSTCLVSEAVDQDKNNFDELIECIDLGNAREDFIARLRAAHPVRDIHNVQHDRRLEDVFTEGAAFAWAFRSSNLGCPHFVTAEGAPDIAVDDTWLEVKTVRNSQEEEQFKEEVLNPQLRRTSRLLRLGFSESSNRTSITRSLNGSVKVRVANSSSTMDITSTSAFQVGLRLMRYALGLPHLNASMVFQL